MKKTLSLLLCLSMLLSATALTVNEAHAAGLANFTTVNEYTEGNFVDVASSAWYYGNVKSSYELGLMMGSSETTFNPTGNMTVAEALALASRIHSIYSTGEASFVQGSPWYDVYVTYAINNNLISGLTENGHIIIGIQTSAPTASITRAQFALIFFKTLPAEEFEAVNEIAHGAIPDVRGSEPYAEAVYLLYNAGIVTGSDAEGTFNPSSNIQRSEVSAITSRIVDKTQRKTFSLNVKENYKSETPCYENSNVPDCGKFFDISCAYADETSGVKRYFYSEYDILNSKYSEDHLDAYMEELEKCGFILTGNAGTKDNPILVFTDGIECVMLTSYNDGGAPALLVALTSYEKAFAN